MERLTKRIEDENTLLTEVGDTACKCFCDNYTLSGCWECPVGKAIEKLADYEDAEEQGLLVRLPVPIGTIVYCIYTGMTGKNATIFANYFNADMCKSWGKFVFTTKEEAEKKLKEMKKNA